MSAFDEAVEALAVLQRTLGQPGDSAQHEVRSLRAVDAWARKRLPIHEGDLVELHGVRAVDGWAPFAASLTDGAQVVAGEIVFNRWSKPEGDWQVACTIEGRTFYIRIGQLRKVDS